MIGPVKFQAVSSLGWISLGTKLVPNKGSFFTKQLISVATPQHISQASALVYVVLIDYGFDMLLI